MHACGDHHSGKRLRMTPPRIKSHFLSRANHFLLWGPDVETAGQPLISTAEEKKKTCSNPLTPIVHSTPAISPLQSKAYSPVILPFQQRLPLFATFAPDSCDGCETETPALCYTREYDEL